MSKPNTPAGPSATAGNTLPEGAVVDFSQGALSYASYLNLEPMLQLQTPLTKEHDETLFIIIHQTSELWMNLMLHEMRGAVAEIRADRLSQAFKMLARVARIQKILIESWGILATMTPTDYLKFRSQLAASSGFQSRQYREIEFMLGNKREAFMGPFKHQEAVYAQLRAVLEGPSLYDEALRALARKGFNIPKTILNRDLTIPHVADDHVMNAWLEVYRNPDQHWELYELAEKLVDLEDSFQQWRFRHLGTVTRIIGFKRGTGGTAGVGYLKRALDYVFFPELWNLRTEL